MTDFLTAGASILGGLGGLFGGSDSPDWRETYAPVVGAYHASKDYGVNILEILRAGNRNPGGQSPNVLSSAAMIANGFDKLDEVLSGDAARQRETERLETELLELELEQKRAGMVSPTVLAHTRTGAGGERLTDDDFYERRDATISRHKNQDEPNAAVIDVPIGPDIDEIISGAVIDSMSRGRGQRTWENKNTAGIPRPVPYDQLPEDVKRAVSNFSPTLGMTSKEGATVEWQGRTWELRNGYLRTKLPNEGGFASG